MAKKKIIFIGLDVDSKNYHVCLIFKETGEYLAFKTKPSSQELVKKLKPYLKKRYELRACYETCFIGFDLCRTLRANKIHCDVIASSKIPRKPGNKVKTDRIDAQKLADYYMRDMLTPVHVPNVEEEADRDLIRTRTFIKKQVVQAKMKIIFFCRQIALDYKEETKLKKYFTGEHLKWLKMKAGALDNEASKACLLLLLKQYSQMLDVVADYDAELEKMANKERYKKKVAALSSFRGISRVFSLQLITEIGDISRFEHPRSLTSYAGLDIIEYSSGGHQRKYSITKTGNKFIRTAAVEACQRVDKTPRETKHLKARRKLVGATPEQIAIADKCMRRLYKKSTKLRFRGKHTNKIKVACAREMLCFVWEALKEAS